MKTFWIRLALLPGMIPLVIVCVAIGAILGIFGGAWRGMVWIDKRTIRILDGLDGEEAS